MAATAAVRRPFVASLTVLCLVLFVWPVVMIAIGAFRTALPGEAGEWSVDGFARAFTDAGTYRSLRQTLGLALAVAVLSKLLAIFFAWVVARTDAPLRSLVTPMMLLVMATPPLFFAISWDMLGNPRVGMINELLRPLLGGESGPVNINSWPGLVFVGALKSTAFGYFLILGPFLAMDRGLEEASLIAGASKAKTFFRIHIPVLAPAILGALVLSFIGFLESFDIPQVIGVPAGIRVLSTEMYGYLNATYGGHYAEASSLAILLMAIVVVLVVLQWRVLGKRKFTVIGGRSYRQDRWRLGRVRWLVTAAIVLFGLLALVLPVFQLYAGSLQMFFGAHGELTLENYRVVLADEQIASALRNTATLSVFGGFVASLACMVFAYVIRTFPGALTRVMNMSLWITVAVPGIVLGLGIMWSFLSVPVLSQLYATVWILFAGLFIAAVPIAMRAAEGAVAQLPAELEEAARISGAGPVRVFVGIVLRLVVPSFLAGWVLAGVLISGNLAVPVLLASPDSSTLAVEVLKLYQDGEVAQAAAVFGLLVLGYLGCAVLAFAAVAAGRALNRGRRRPLLISTSP